MDTKTYIEKLNVSDASERLSRTLALEDDIGRLRYVSDARREALLKLNIKTVRDMFLHAPHRYLDFGHTAPIGLVNIGQDASVVGRVDKVNVKNPRPNLSIVEVFVIDKTGVINATFFKQPWVANQIHVGDMIALSGKVIFNYGFKQMRSPFFEILSDKDNQLSFAKILPIHPVCEGISLAWMRRIVSAAIGDLGDICDYLPARICAEAGLMTRNNAIRQIHFPDTMAAAELGRRRLAYDELFLLQVAMHARQNILRQGVEPVCHKVAGPHMEAFYKALPFVLSDEQLACVSEILGDMSVAKPMNRLLLGDVGTGKTIVAAVALACVADTNTQAAFMAPTSVLAAQHEQNLGPLLDKAKISHCLITGATPAALRQEYAQLISEGKMDVVFGTTALLSDDIQFQRLSLVVIDEQHRFGVSQRAKLREKGAAADLLSMSATPIPRTLALSVYGDMDLSRIVHKPYASQPTHTQIITPENEDLAYKAIRTACKAGHQVYIVCPLIDDEDVEAHDMAGEVVAQKPGASRRFYPAVGTQKKFAQAFPEYKVGLLHGRMSASEKDKVMAEFSENKINILVSTTVIEVGVDVANASLMLIYDADRFGLATLHQLRGRVGRGSIPGEVMLITPARKKSPARARLEALVETDDGFALANRDLQLRHEGEVLGYRQHGGVSLILVDLIKDADLVLRANKDAKQLLGKDPYLQSEEGQTIAYEAYMTHRAYFEEVVHG